MEETRKNKQSKLFAIRDYVVVAVVALALLFYKDASTDIINYPSILIPCISVALVILLLILRFRQFEIKYISIPKVGDRLFYAAVCIAISVIGAWTVAYMLLVPFNYCNTYIAQKNTADTIRCEIVDASTGKIGPDASPNLINYSFQGTVNTIKTNTESPLIANMHELNLYSQFQLKLTVHKALLGSYLLQDWKIENKPGKQLNGPK